MSSHPPPPEVAVTRVLNTDAGTAWALLTDTRNHARWIPLTQVSTDGTPRLGTRITAVSGPFTARGVPGFTDRMRVDAYDPPTGGATGRAVFTKLGPVLLGTAGVHVTALPDGRSRVTWTEQVRVRGPWPRASATVLAPVLRGMLRFALHRVAAEVDAGPSRTAPTPA